MEEARAAARLWGFIFFLRAMVISFLSVFSSEWPCLDASVLERSLWYRMGNGLQGWRADQEMPLQEAMWGWDRDGTDSGEIRI